MASDFCGIQGKMTHIKDKTADIRELKCNKAGHAATLVSCGWAGTVMHEAGLTL